MSDWSYSITVYIAEMGTPLNDGSWKTVEYVTTDDSGNEVRFTREVGNTSYFGHMWFSLNGSIDGIAYYGFGPAEHGQAKSEGKVYRDDDKQYAYTKYQETYPLTEAQYLKIKKFAEDAANFNTFGKYQGLYNACVDFCFTALRVGEVFSDMTFDDALPVPLDGSVLPGMNVQNLKSIKTAYMAKWDSGFFKDIVNNDDIRQTKEVPADSIPVSVNTKQTEDTGNDNPGNTYINLDLATNDETSDALRLQSPGSTGISTYNPLSFDFKYNLFPERANTIDIAKQLGDQWGLIDNNGNWKITDTTKAEFYPSFSFDNFSFNNPNAIIPKVLIDIDGRMYEGEVS